MELGQIGATATLVRHCEKHEIDLSVYLAQYEANDWGILEEEDCHSNNMEMLALAGHVFGKYTLTTGEDIYIETTWNERKGIPSSAPRKSDRFPPENESCSNKKSTP